MAATIIQFPQTHSNIFLNLTQLINMASDNQVVEEYAEIMAVSNLERLKRSRSRSGQDAWKMQDRKKSQQ